MTVNEFVGNFTINKNYPTSQEPISNSTDEDELMKLFYRFFGFTPSSSDLLELDTTIVTSEASLQGKSTTYQVTIQNLTTIALLNTGANISVILKKFFKPLPQNHSYQKYTHTHKVMSVSGITLCPIGQCNLTFQLRNKHFTDRFIVLQDL